MLVELFLTEVSGGLGSSISIEGEEAEGAKRRKDGTLPAKAREEQEADF